MLQAIQLLRTNLPDDCALVAPTGGYFIWIQFPNHINVVDLNAFARQHHRVAAIAGNEFSADGKFKHCIRLSIAFFGGAKLRSALLAICEAYAAFVAGRLREQKNGR